MLQPGEKMSGSEVEVQGGRVNHWKRSAACDFPTARQRGCSSTQPSVQTSKQVAAKPDPPCPIPTLTSRCARFPSGAPASLRTSVPPDSSLSLDPLATTRALDFTSGLRNYMFPSAHES